MIRQILTELTENEFEKAAFIQVRSKDTLADIDADLNVSVWRAFSPVTGFV